MPLNLDKTITWMPPTNSNVDNFRTEFDRIYGNFTELNDVHPRIQTVEETLFLTSQTVEAGVTADTPVYFDLVSNLWKRYRSNVVSNRPALFMGSGLVALEGAVVTLTFSGNTLFIDDSGVLVSSLAPTHITRRQSLGYRVGTNSFKLEHKHLANRLPVASEHLMPNGIADNHFYGHSLAISGDRVVVPSYGQGHSGASNAGVVDFFKLYGQQWRIEETQYADDASAAAYFGVSIDMEGDKAIIGAYGDNTRASEAGSAYIFRYDGSYWVTEQKLYPTVSEQDARFGRSVALEGNLAVVGAYTENVNGTTNAGGVYIFRFDGSVWTEEAHLTPDNPSTEGYFGYQVEVQGDVVVVGAADYDIGATNTGAAYVYRYDGSSWALEQELLPDNVHNEMRFGYDLDIYGDRIIVGSYKETTTAGALAGAAYIFRYDGTSWVKEVRLTAPDGVAGDEFGIGVAMDGDTIAVGAWEAHLPTTADAGLVYIFQFNGTDWIVKDKIHSLVPSTNARFGHTVALEGDLLAVGSHVDPRFAPNGGTCYLYNLNYLR